MTALSHFVYQYLFDKYFRTQASNHGFIKPRLKITLATLFFLLQFIAVSVSAQEIMDTTKNKQKWNFHYQSTLITQYHPTFRANYSGRNSLDPNPESSTSVSGTLFFGAKLWKGAEAYFNPEISGGSGFSQTTGIAGFPNGEAYRVSDPVPHIYVARLFLKQIFPLSKKYGYREDGINQIASKVPASYFAVTAGKFCIMDFFDNNLYGHDPRTQFFNWALMGNGAWDYPANTRGYTYGLVVEFVKPTFAIRFSTVMVPTTANGGVMDPDVLQARSEALEFEHKYTLGNKSGTIRWMTYLTHAQMGSYRKAQEQGINLKISPEIEKARTPGRTKFGLGINIDQPVTAALGAFLRAGWNDGRNETWAFTEIDHHLSAGVVWTGIFSRRNSDQVGFAQIINGLSKEHREYLKAGGYGFIIGDGDLNYGLESISEFYYSFRLSKYGLWLAPDYQFILNPAYNKVRGPVHSLGIRVHFEI